MAKPPTLLLQLKVLCSESTILLISAIMRGMLAVKSDTLPHTHADIYQYTRNEMVPWFLMYLLLLSSLRPQNPQCCIANTFCSNDSPHLCNLIGSTQLLRPCRYQLLIVATVLNQCRCSVEELPASKVNWVPVEDEVT